MRTSHWIYSSLLTSLIGVGCTHDAPPPPPPLTDSVLTAHARHQLDTLTDSRNPATEAAVRLIFEKFPAEYWHLLSFRTLDKSVKTQLLKRGQLVPFILDIKNHTFELREFYQQDDDLSESRQVAQAAIFGYTENPNKWLVFVLEKNVTRESAKPEQIVRQTFWQFDGKAWRDVTDEQPQVSLDLFYEQRPQPLIAQQHRSATSKVELIPTCAILPEVANELEYILPSHAPHPISYTIKLVWTGEHFQLHREPLRWEAAK